MAPSRGRLGRTPRRFRRACAGARRWRGAPSDPDRRRRRRRAPDPRRLSRRRPSPRAGRGRRGAACAGGRAPEPWPEPDGVNSPDGDDSTHAATSLGRGLPAPARPLRRGRDGAGPPRARRDPLCRRRRPRLRRGHGQGDDEARVPGRGAPDPGLPGGPPLRVAAQRGARPGGSGGAPRLSDVRQARKPRLERRRAPHRRRWTPLPAW